MKTISSIKELNKTHGNLLLISFIALISIYLISELAKSFLDPRFLNFYKPIFLGLIPFTASLILLLFCRKQFKMWLARIASWYVPLAVFLIANTDVYGDMYSYGRSATAFALMSGLFVVTVIFVVVVKLREKKKIT